MPQAKLNVDTLFCEAIAIDDAAARLAFIERASSSNPELRQHLEKLVAAHFRAGEFLQQPVVSVEAGIHATEPEPAATVAPSREPGSTIGPYKIRELLGEGGMGSVYVAEQERPVRRKVALKVIKPGMDSRAVVARFEAERQALTLMDHPHIARVLDAGTTDSGHPYFVMELVKGLPITEYCDLHRLAVNDRLELFIQVCRAVQHAHHKAVIHRDLKPSNILVAVHDTTPVVKVIDFGVAKALGSKLTDHTLYTGFNQLVGTPLYMSPEQAGMSSLDIDTRSDIYSLGVLLYELLSGSTPFDDSTLKQAGYDEMRRLIREVDPPRPSARISTLKAVDVSTIAERRHVEPRYLSRTLRGDLDWIVMKALEKDRTRRYETVNSLARDIERYLNDEPVSACPPTKAYQMKKFWQRHRAAVLAASVVLVALLLTALMAVTLAVREHQSTERRLLVQQGINDSLTQAAGLRNQARTSELGDQAALSQAREQMQRALALAESGEADAQLVTQVRQLASELDQERRDGQLLRALDAAWLAEVNLDGDQRFASVRRIPDLRNALTADGLAVGQDDPLTVAAQIKNRHEKVRTEVVAALYEWYTALSPPIGVVLSDQDPGLITYVSPQSTAGRDRLLKNRDRIIGVGQRPGGTLTRTAGMTAPQIRELLRGESGTTVRLEVLSANATESQTLEIPRDATAAWLWAVIQAADPDPWRRRVREACQLEDETVRRAELEKFVDEADPAIQPVRFLNQLGAELMRADAIDRATSFLEQVWQQYPADVTTNISMAVCLRANNPPQNEEALRYYTTVIALKPGSRQIRHYRGYVLSLLGKHEEAIADFRSAIRLAPDDPSSYFSLGNQLASQGKREEAIAQYRQVIRLGAAYVAEARDNLGNVLASQDKLEEAVAEYREAIRLRPDDSLFHSNLGVALCRQGKWEEGISEFREAIQLDANGHSSEEGVAAGAHNNLAYAFFLQGKLEESIAEYREAIRAKPGNAEFHYDLGEVLNEQGHSEEALAELRESVRLTSDEANGPSGFRLSIAHWRLGHRDEARQHYDKSAKWMEENHVDDKDLKSIRAKAAGLLGIAEEEADNTPEDAQMLQ